MVSLWKLRVNCTSIAWVMVAAVLVLNLAPHHIHLHHGSPSGLAAHDHEHTRDLHLLSDVNDAAHHNEAMVYEVTPDGLPKPLSDSALNWSLIVFLLVLLPIPDLPSRHRLTLEAIRLPQACYRITPPLRAPPRP
jgi:hypothetical protein